MGVHENKSPNGTCWQVLLVGTVNHPAQVTELQHWLMAALREKAGTAVSKGGIILPTTMTDAKEVK